MKLDAFIQILRLRMSSYYTINLLITIRLNKGYWGESNATVFD